MSTLDDPMLALIARFVRADMTGLELCNETYLREQFAEIKAYIEAFPESVRDQATLDWICEHAERYRRQWQKRELSHLLLDQRCDDCPMLDDGSNASCIIHTRWVGLLKEYIAGDINSERYVEATLRLLDDHKNQIAAMHSEGIKSSRLQNPDPPSCSSTQRA